MWQFLFNCIGGVTIFIYLYWSSDNFYLIVLEEWQFLFNCFGGITIPHLIVLEECFYLIVLEEYGRVLIVLEEWQLLFNCIGEVTIFI